MLLSFIFSILFSFLFYSFGFLMTVFWNFEKKHSHFKMLFLRMTLGIIAVTTIFAIVKTNGNTILLGVLVIFIFFLVYNKNFLKLKPKFENFELDFYAIKFYVFILLIFNFLFTYLLFPNSYGAHPDYLFYGALSDYLTIYSKENFYLSIYESEQLNNTLYHFYNEWCIGFISNIIGKTGTYSLLYIFFPITCSILYIGLTNLTQVITKYSILKSFLLVFIFFAASSLSLGEGLPSLFEMGGFHFYYASFLSAPSSGKTIVVTILLLFMITFYDKTKEYNSVLILTLICFIWPSTILGILGGITLYLFYKFFYKKEKIIFELIIILVTIFCFGIIFIMKKNDVKLSDETELSYFDFLSDFISKGIDYNVLLNTLIETIGSRFYYYSILLLIIFLNFKTLKAFLSKKMYFKDLGLLLLLITISAFISRILLFFISDSNQIFTNIFDNTLAKLLFFIILLISLQNKFNYIFVLLFACLSMLTFFHQHVKFQSKTIESHVLSELKRELLNKNYKFATILKIKKSKFSHISQVVYPPLYELRSFCSYYFPVNLTILEREYQYQTNISLKNRYQVLKNNASFYRYVKERRIKNVDWSVKKQFLKDLKINFLIVEKGALNEKEISQLDVDKELKTFNKSVRLFKLLN